MNVALPALAIFFIFLPGFMARSRFKRAERLSLDYSPFGQVVTEAVLWTCLFHLVWIGISHLFFSRELQPAVLLRLLSSDAASQSRAVDEMATCFGWVAFYFLTLIPCAYVLPMLFRRLITHYRLDRFNAPLSPIFRFHKAPWYYLLTGADFEKESRPDFIAISAIVNIAGVAVLYTGILDEFFVNVDGELDRLILQQVMRRPIAADKEHALTPEENLERFYAVDGDYFVLRYSEAITLNIEYIKLAPEDEIPVTDMYAGDGSVVEADKVPA
jgi:hypothetical protein